MKAIANWRRQLRIDNQQPDGLWKLESDKEIKSRDDQERLWLELEICRMLKRYYG